MKKLITPSEISMEVGGRETSASICYTIRTIDDVTCGKEYSDEKTCLDIPLTPIKCGPNDNQVNGTIQTEAGDITYTITQKHYDCPSTDECTCKCTDVRTWTVPYYIDDDYPDDGEVRIYYEYWYTSAGTNTVCSREKRIGYSATTKANLPKEGDGYKNPIIGTIEQNCSECKYEAFVSKSTGCKSESSTSLTINFSTIPADVPGTGGSVTVICNFKKVIIDNKCNKKTESGSFTSAVTIAECNLSSKGVECCVDHDIELKMSISTILGKLIPQEDRKYTEVIYNGVSYKGNGQNPPTGDLSFYITQRRRYDGICNGDCEYITTYCVSADTVTIWYESEFGKGDWKTEGCLPMYGGRIKVTWAYTATTHTEVENPSCPSDRITSVYEDYMSIGDCRDPYHPDDYQIYFKEQTPGCTTCSGETMTEGEFKNKKVNTFKIHPCQACCVCKSITNFILAEEGECTCNDFEFVEPTPTCNCNDFEFIEPSPSCNCYDFEFVEPTPTCDCNDFEFVEPTPTCDCNDFEFVEPTPTCDCNDFEFKNPCPKIKPADSFGPCEGGTVTFELEYE